MKKLEVGDYVKNLTEKHFNNIMKFQPDSSIKYRYIKGQTDELIYHGGYIDYLTGYHGVEIKTELTYLQFLSRAKNTFK